MILIMAVMLGMYQYFTAKRSSDVTLNKDERAFEVELNCLKQFHDYGATRNEAQLTEGFINPGYTCANAENIKMYKYCLNNNIETPCADINITEHCITTTMSKPNLDNSLKALLFKKGIEEVKAGNILKGKKISSNNHHASTSTETNFGLVSCVSAERISQNEKLAKDNCKKEGKFATKLPNGSWICTDVPELSECTAHEISVTDKTGKEYCTGPVNNKYCCANPNIANNICGNDPNLKATWNTATRFYTCTTGDEVCNKTNQTMQALNENNASIGQITIEKTNISAEKFYTAKYNTANKQWECIPNAEKLIKECKSFLIKNKHAFSSVSNLTTVNGIPVCYGASEESANAIETCSACGTAELNQLTGQWECQYATTWKELHAKGPTYIDKLRGNSTGTNNKGVDACFKGCKDNMIESIKAGKPNGVIWGLTWNSNSKLWECFSCNTEITESDGKKYYSYINDRCIQNKNTKACTDQNATDADCDKDGIQTNGRCVLRCCNDLYQKRGTDGYCYTKWCRNIPSNVKAMIGKPREDTCPDGLRIMYNEQKDCTYCIRPDPIRLE